MNKTFDKIRVASRRQSSSFFASREPKLLLTLLGLACIITPLSRAQTLPAPSLAHRPTMVGPIQTAPPAAVPAPVPTTAPAAAVGQLDQLPDQGAPADPPKPVAPKPPRVTYKAGQLTISAENSTLSDILASLRTATGAEIDMPPGAAGDHLWVNLGPGPARKVLADLLSETRLDFIIQAADSPNNPDGIRSVSLTPRTETPSATARVMTPVGRPLPPRQSDAERRVPVRIPAESRAQQQEDTVAPEAPDPNISVEAAPAAAATPVQAMPAEPAAAAAPTVSAASSATDTQSSDSSKTPTAAPSPMFQTLQDLYAQRKQMQALPAPASTGTN
jgi:hypothetical protein